METTIQTNVEDWVEYLDSFTLDNTGRLVILKILYPNGEEEVIARDIPLVGLSYYNIEKGNEITLDMGTDSQDISHTIESPVELEETKSHAKSLYLKISTIKEEAYELIFVD